jgi:DNA-binding transcriptional ArsR family regulator
MVNSKKQLLFEKQAAIAGAIAHPLRIAILDYLKDGPQCVCDIEEHVGSERSNVSRHLAMMVNAGVLEYRKQGLKVIYSLKCPCIMEFFSCVTGIIQQQAKDSGKLLQAMKFGV